MGVGCGGERVPTASVHTDVSTQVLTRVAIQPTQPPTTWWSDLTTPLSHHPATTEACEAAISRHGKHEGEDGSAAGGNGAVARNSRLALDRLHGIEPEEEAVTDDQCSVM